MDNVLRTMMDNLLKEAGRLADLTFMLERLTAQKAKKLQELSSAGTAQDSQNPLIKSEEENSNTVPSFQTPHAVYEEAVGCVLTSIIPLTSMV